MNLYIFAQNTTQPVCSNASYEAALQALSTHSAPSEVVEELKTIKEASFAFECQTSNVAGFKIAQEVKAGKLRFNISKTVEKTPLRILEVSTEAEGKALIDAEMGFKTIKNQGGKRWLINAKGNIVHSAQADELAIPVLSTLCDVYGGMIGAVA